ncbi:exopolysaccharide biosynthesis protein [Aporhodopirellula aestuarii]|uniref:Exopolysaccharide biosynthesis protein n=1 Tax=Aporhodopirellula aestuarii TaxID=2950107 RepID=A0ABT0UFI0_9BACT|nr:exopolysaccharide biosynthesis protein [Aporhodopirellula aestuarii]MCM2374993.1 exopolysaccharide biosynthesis protein [Aporhodopirellula aestuarii]
MSDSPAHPVEDILDEIDHAADQHDPLTLGDVMDILGQQTFAPLLLLIGLTLSVPGPADIPGVPVALGLLVIIVAAQIVMHRKHLWIPQWMERQKVKAERAGKMVSWARKPARWLDHVTKPRWEWLINHAGKIMIAIACILIAMTTPVLEFVPFSANVAGAAIAAFAVALLAKDGLLASLAICLSLATAGLVIYQMI